MSGEGLALIGALGVAAIAGRGWRPQAIGGLTLGADPVAYAIAAASHARGEPLNAFTVRKTAKQHGTGRRIEGCFESGDTVVIVEDVITTGASALEAIAAVQAEGARVLGVLAVVDREEGGAAAIAAAGHALAVLLTARDLGLDAPVVP
jgi:orotate phosphoribosyltransferase